MKSLTFIISIILASTLSISAQNIVGQWNGVLNVQGMQLRLVFNISETENGLSATMDSPDQGVNGIHVSSVTFQNGKIDLSVSNMMISYKGELKDDEIIGTFKQGTIEMPMNMSRHQIEKQKPNRPQEPNPPFPYYTEEVTFRNSNADITFGATLTMPSKEGNFPAVVLITGSGAQNRDEELFGHKPFLVIADYLTRNGIAVLRYDDRGVGASGGSAENGTTADFATDVESAVGYLKKRKEINPKQIGLIGHSEGGIIAPMVASQSEDVSFIVLLAGTGVRGDKLLLSQQKAIASASGMSEEAIMLLKRINGGVMNLIVNSSDTRNLKEELIMKIDELLDSEESVETPDALTREKLVDMQIKQMLQPWMISFLKLDPAPFLERVKCPVLALNGEKDLQVPASENLPAIKNALLKGGNKQVSTIEYPGLNHLFQECQTGLPAEYGVIEQTFSPAVLDDIVKWIQGIVN